MNAETEILNDMKKQGLELSAEEQKEYARKMIQAREAGDLDTENFYRDILMRANLALVVSIAAKNKGKGVDLGDLIQEGLNGLLRAIEKYNPETANLTTYAYRWIQMFIILDILRNSSSIEIADHMQYTMMKVYKAEAELIQELDKDADQITDQEIAERTSLKLKEVAEARNLIKIKTGLSIEGVSGAAKGEESNTGDDEMLSIISKNSNIGGIEDAEEQNLILHTMMSEERTKILIDILKKNLTEREFYFSLKRWGLREDGTQDEIMSLAEVGRYFQAHQIPGGVTRERMRQMEREILMKLRKVPEMNEWKDYFEIQYREL